MGLSTISATLRRRKAPSKTARPSLNAPQISSFFQLPLPSWRPKLEPPPSPRRFRFKDLSAADIVDKLSHIEQVVPQEHTNNLADHLASNDPIFSDFVSLITEPSDVPGSPREQYKRAWVVATLLRYGPPVLRETLVRKPPLVRKLASVFNAPCGEVDPSLVAHITDVLRVLLHEFPKETATALYNTPFVSRLVDHIGLQPVADLLPRLVGARVFTSLTPAPIIPGHKRATAMMGKAMVQTALAKQFLTASNAVLDGNTEALRVVEGCCNAMAEISVRAMSLPRKPEDQDERADVGYAGNLFIVAAHVYNDSKDHMNLLQQPQPLIDVLSHTVENMRDIPEVLIPVLNMVTTVLHYLRQFRSSLLPTMRKSVVGQDTSRLGQGLVSLRSQFVRMLSEGDRILGRKRLAVVDLLREACATLEETSVDHLLCDDDFQVLRALLKLVVSYRTNEILLVAVSQTLSAVFDSYLEVASKALRSTDLSDVLHGLRTEMAMESALASLVACQGVDRVMQDGDEGLKRQLSALEEYYDEHVKGQMEAGLVKGSEPMQPKISEEMANSLDLEDELSTSEDYRHDVFIHGLLEEVGRRRETRTPPEDSMMGDTEHDIAKVWSQGLTRLKAHGGSKKG